jgi:hypothetical protein
MDVTESHAETESDLETVGSKHLPTKRAGGIMEGSTKQKKSDIKMSVEELLETKRKISNAMITAVREMKHDVFKGGDHRGRKKIQTSSLVVFATPSFGSGMQFVENHGTQKQIKLEKQQIDLLGFEEIIAVFPNLRSEVQTLDSSNSKEHKYTLSTQAVVVKQCQDVRERLYGASRNANPWMRAPHFCFCDAQVESVRIVVSKLRISVSVKTSLIKRPGSWPNRHPLDYRSESWTDIHNHQSMNPYCFGIRRPVRPPPNGWFPRDFDDDDVDDDDEDDDSD